MKSVAVGAAIAALAMALGGCGKQPEPVQALAPSAASMALEPLI